MKTRTELRERISEYPFDCDCEVCVRKQRQIVMENNGAKAPGSLGAGNTYGVAGDEG